MDWRMMPVMADQRGFYIHRTMDMMRELEALVIGHELLRRFPMERYKVEMPAKALRDARTHGMAAGHLQKLHLVVLQATADAGKGKSEARPVEAFMHPDLLREMIHG